MRIHDVFFVGPTHKVCVGTVPNDSAQGDGSRSPLIVEGNAQPIGPVEASMGGYHPKPQWPAYQLWAFPEGSHVQAGGNLYIRVTSPGNEGHVRP